MFKKILIANRGEIACRVMATARRLGIKTVAVYSDADADSKHVRWADEAVRIGPPPSAQSYLLADKIVEACKATGAEAVHPGYGFLSEKEHFAAALAKAGIVFIGPPPSAMAAMGDKIESKKLAQKAGVSTVPGHLADIATAAEALTIARGIGYPVMIKASAGGGGKGMRVAHSDKEVEEGFRSAKAEAKSAFADDRVFVEKFVEEPRHIEIQVIADGHGTCLYLGERECSIQRRHQKVIEEAPSPFLDAATRKAMGEQAMALARAVGYRSAGTVEFIVDRNRKFYFLEMNTRLQVEHPVTEAVTGLDLVELMIRIAAGEKLGLTQDRVKLDGWAIEARVYAEDPYRNFLPSIGRVVGYRPPAGSAFAGPADGRPRIDAGVEEGSEIGIFYDPMIAKLVTWGRDRGEATSRMRTALDGFHVRGVNHNVAFLASLMAHPRFESGNLTTAFIAEEYPEGFRHTPPVGARLDRFVAVAAALQNVKECRDIALSGQMPGRALKASDVWHCAAGTHAIHARLAGGPGDCTVRLGNGHSGPEPAPRFAIKTDWQPGQPVCTADIDGTAAIFQVERLVTGWRLMQGGFEVSVSVLPPHAAEMLARMPAKAPPDTSKFLLSPMPGLLVSLAVKAGQPVKAGEELAVVEAMKMQNVLRAERDGTVKALHAKPGDSLAVDQTIVEFG